VLIDDRLPVSSTPRRAELAFASRLAFCRCTSATGEQQLWASLVEKAYAKAHGSYQAISGGQINTHIYICRYIYIYIYICICVYIYVYLYI